jgi:hypothetical protein
MFWTKICHRILTGKAAIHQAPIKMSKYDKYIQNKSAIPLWIYHLIQKVGPQSKNLTDDPDTFAVCMFDLRSIETSLSFLLFEYLRRRAEICG